jgi:beta-galactosidase
MFDFASAIRDEGGTVGFNSKGLVTRDRAVRKDAFYVYKANWSTEPMVHVCSKRFVNRSGDSMVVKVYSNQPVVSLQVNGTDLGEQTSEDRIFTWEVPLSEEVSVVAVSGDVRDEATVHQVDADDPTYVCDEPRRAVTAGRMDSWYEEQGIVLDRSGFGFWSLLGELLDNPETRAILVDLVGEEMLNHPQIEIGRNFTLELVLGAVTDLEPERIAELQTRLGAVTRPAG